MPYLRVVFLSLLIIFSLSFPAFCGEITDDEAEGIEGFPIDGIEALIARFRDSSGSELGSSQLFIMMLCDALDLPRPAAPRSEAADNAYTFEAQISFTRANGSRSTGRIDLYKKGCMIWESKQGSPKISKKEKDELGAWRQGTAVRGTRSWDRAMIQAKIQAEEYANGLSVREGRPPFIIVADIGEVLEVYSNFSGEGEYAPFPSAKDNRIYLEDLRRPEIQERLKLIWTEPMSLDPARNREKVTKHIAGQLAELALSLEESGHSPEAVASNIMCFTLLMFAEDVNLLPNGSFTRLLDSLQDKPEKLNAAIEGLWQDVARGGQSKALKRPVFRFSGPFEIIKPIALNPNQLSILRQAAQANWAAVETAIFGTFLERALNPKERHKLGAHYTPPSYVERLVYPTVMEPMRAEWAEVKKKALVMVNSGDHASAIWEIEAFHKKLSETVILDPSCGSGNFLSVALSLAKDLEGEVVEALRSLGKTDLDIARRGYTVSPRQFRGIEISPHAVAVSRVVLWISYLQRHYQVYGNVPPAEPIFEDFGNIECRDAVLAWDTSGDQGNDPRYVNARQADPWPTADYIVGNPPFIGALVMRRALGDSYVDALRSAYSDVPDTSDYVMYWWHRAAELVRSGQTQRFGFITPSSVRQRNVGKTIQHHLSQKPPLNLVFAVPDHPWTGPNVREGRLRVAMTVGALGSEAGTLAQVILERPGDDYVRVDMDSRKGKINADLAIGVDTKLLKKLKSNSDLATNGMILIGQGFLVTEIQAKNMGLGSNPDVSNYIRRYRNGKDVADLSRDLMVIDLFGVKLDDLKWRFPEIYKHLVDHVKPQRDKNRREHRQKHWWLFGETNEGLRKALEGLPRYIATPATSRRRFFVFLDADIVPANKLVAIASDDAYTLGVLSSRIHVDWSLAVGGRQGIGADPVYIKTVCFDAFPFPEASQEQRERIAALAEAIEKHRHERQARHPELTLSRMYAVLELMSHQVYLEAADQKTSDDGDLPALMQLHEELDVAVAEAYGWLADLTSEEVLERLLLLNQLRSKEEGEGIIRWLRPEYQNPPDKNAGGPRLPLFG